MDAYFRWFEGEKAQFRFVPYDWAFLLCSYLFRILLFFFLTGCFYDPPKKGKEIIFENQTSQFIYVSGSLPEPDLKLFDTLLVNKRIYISAKANYIPKYNKWVAFLSEKEIKKRKETDSSNLIFYVVSEPDKGSSYNKITLSSDEIEKNDLNYVFIYPDSFSISHEHNIEARRN